VQLIIVSFKTVDQTKEAR